MVTGGGSGIGRASAIAFAREGANVVIGNRNVQRGEETVAMIQRAGCTASFKKTDVLVTKEIEALVDHAVKTYGPVGGGDELEKTGRPCPDASDRADRPGRRTSRSGDLVVLRQIVVCGRAQFGRRRGIHGTIRQ